MAFLWFSTRIAVPNAASLNFNNYAIVAVTAASFQKRL